VDCSDHRFIIDPLTGNPTQEKPEAIIAEMHLIGKQLGILFFSWLSSLKKLQSL